MPRSSIDWPQHVRRSIRAALAGRSKLTRQALVVEGLTSPTVRHFLNCVCSLPAVNYLEIGTLKGSTLVAASYENPGRFTAVDNFSELTHLNPKEGFEATRKRFATTCHFTFHDADCWNRRLLRRLPSKVNVYFYDGSHRYENQYRAFTHFDPVFANPFVAIVDDWNQARVRQGTRDAFEELGYTTLFEREFRTKLWIREHWWNGMFIAVVQKKRRRPSRKKTAAKRASR